MIMQQTKIQEHLETFRRYFYKAKKCYVSEKQDFIAYGYDKINIAYMDYLAANKLIEKLNLPLVAIHTQGSTSFHIQSNQTSDI